MAPARQRSGQQRGRQRGERHEQPHPHRRADRPASIAAGLRVAVLGLLAAIGLAGCAGLRQPAPPADDLFHDTHFDAPAEPVSAEAALDASPAMRTYVRGLRVTGHAGGPVRALVSALQSGDLRLAYDGERTRSAAEAFEARSGNCLSLVLMTAALAREMGLRVRFNQVEDGALWERSGNLAVRIGHVNVSLAEPLPAVRGGNVIVEWVTIDFDPLDDANAAMRSVEIDERRVATMLLNNRAVEALLADRIDDAYARARDALRRDPGYVEAYTTLAVIYRRRGLADAAEAVLRRALAIAPEHVPAIGNLAVLLRARGEVEQADRLLAQARRIEPVDPIEEMEAGQRALAARDYGQARRLFQRALRHGADPATLHHGLAVIAYETGDKRAAARELELAQRHSTSRQQRELYAAKRERLLERSMQ